MWNWIQAFILSIIIIAIGHFIWQFLRDNFTKPIVKPFVMPENQQIQSEITNHLDNHNNSDPNNNLKNEIDNDNDMELDNYLKSKINVLNTTDLTELSSHYDTPSSQTTLSQN